MANYAHIEDGQITGVYDLYPENWRNISNFYLLSNDADAIYNLGWRTIVKTTPSYSSDTHYLSNPIHSLVDDTVYETLEVVAIVFSEEITYTVDQINSIQLEQHNSAIEILRQKRDKLLSDTDFTQLADVIALNGAELTQLFVLYRQALRDLPNLYETDSQFVDESTVIYPVYPVLNISISETSTEPDTTTSDGETTNPGDV